MDLNNGANRVNPNIGLSQNGILSVETSERGRGRGMTKLTQTQIGSIGEVTVAAQLMLLSNGRLSPFLPFADDDGIDLFIFIT